MAKIIVSYDDTDNDRDALALGRVLGELGGEISLAYVRHTQQPDSAREALEEKDAEELLEHGAEALGDEKTPRHVVVHASTGAGLWELAESERADVVVFGSDYRTAEGAVMPGTSAQRLLTGGPVAVAMAPAGLRSREARSRPSACCPRRTATTPPATRQRASPRRSARTVADRHEGADLLVVGSSPASPKGHVNLSARAGYAIETSNSPVLAVAARHGDQVLEAGPLRRARRRSGFPQTATAGIEHETGRPLGRPLRLASRRSAAPAPRPRRSGSTRIASMPARGRDAGVAELRHHRAPPRAPRASPASKNQAGAGDVFSTASRAA